MPENTNVAALTSLKKRKPAGRMTIGIDLGDRRSHFCVLTEQGQAIVRGFLPTTISAFRREFEGLPSSLVAIEAGAHSLLQTENRRARLPSVFVPDLGRWFPGRS